MVVRGGMISDQPEVRHSCVVWIYKEFLLNQVSGNCAKIRQRNCLFVSHRLLQCDVPLQRVRKTKSRVHTEHLKSVVKGNCGRLQYCWWKRKRGQTAGGGKGRAELGSTKGERRKSR